MTSIQTELPYPPLRRSPRDLLTAKKSSSAGRPRRLPGDDTVVGSAQWEKLLAEIDEFSLIADKDLELVEMPQVGSARFCSPAVAYVESRVVNSAIIKVSLDKETVARIDAAREHGMTLTRPAFVRYAVDDMLAYLVTHDVVQIAQTPKTKEPGRKLYLKVAFPPAIVKTLGHHKPEPFGLCARFMVTRRAVVNYALRRLLER
jgi:hypothetical protein